MILLYKYVQRKRKEKAQQACESPQQAPTSPVSESPLALSVPVDENEAVHEVKDHLVETNPKAAVVNQEQQQVVSAEVNDDDGQAEISRRAKIAARHYRVRIIAGLFFPFALQALDTTIIASALPWIASDFSVYCPMKLRYRY